MFTRLRFAGCSISAVVALLLAPALATAQDDSVEKEIRAEAAKFAAAFNAGKADDVVAQFLPEGELIDEAGTIYRGHEKLAAALTKFFEKFPGVQLALDVESVRAVGPNMAIEEGTRFIEAKAAEGKAVLRYLAVHSKADGQWRIASLREFAADPLPTPGERLAPLEFLVGDWVNEGSDGVVKLAYRWTENQSFLLGSYLVTSQGNEVLRSQHRIGWDPVAGKIRSWLFDSDGGFSQGVWTPTTDGWIVKSTSVNPDGSTGSATIRFVPKSANGFTLKMTDRIVGDVQEEDLELSVVRVPPPAKN